MRNMMLNIVNSLQLCQHFYKYAIFLLYTESQTRPSERPQNAISIPPNDYTPI